MRRDGGRRPRDPLVSAVEGGAVVRIPVAFREEGSSGSQVAAGVIMSSKAEDSV